ncbi:hypothetical protein Gogos_005803, partial [Gossypium gossypioides]|nr:hypothetical protein [Gossypium gossypioides]
MVGANPSGSNSGVGRATKKVHSKTELPLDTDDPTVDGNGQKVQESEVPRVSYKSTLLGASQALTQNTLLDEEFVLMDDDVTTLVVEGVLSITTTDEKRSIHRRVKNDGQNDVNGGSRFAALGEVEGDEQDTVNDLINDKKVERRMEKNKVMGSVGDLMIQGTNKQTKENRMRQQVKRNGLLIGIEPKAISKALRPNNGKMGVRVKKKINGKFDDGLKMGPKEVEGYGGNFMIQPINVSLNLNQEKHKALHYSVELRATMNGLVREFEWVPKKAPMEDDTSFIKEVMVIEDACNDE